VGQKIDFGNAKLTLPKTSIPGKYLKTRKGPISGYPLEIEMIPPSTWGISLAQKLPRPIWDSIRREVYQSSGHSCSLCKAINTQLHCHEIWSFNESKGVQTLTGLQCLCQDCHNIKHWGRTSVLVEEGTYPLRYKELLIGHFCSLNRCKRSDFFTHRDKAWVLFQRRSTIQFKIDFGQFDPSRVTKLWSERGGK